MSNKMPRGAKEKIESELKSTHKNLEPEITIALDDAQSVEVPKRKKTLLVIVISLLITVVLGISIGYYLQHNHGSQIVSCSDKTLPNYETLIVGDFQLAAEVAQSREEKQQGLSGRNCLDDGTAMLFPYDVAGDYCFWMKDMKFPIDMVWLDDEKKVVTIAPNNSPDSYPFEYCPDRPAQYIVEVQAGLARQQNWHDGTQFKF